MPRLTTHSLGTNPVRNECRDILNHNLYFHKPMIRAIAYVILSVFLFWTKGFQVCVCVCVREREIEDICYIKRRKKHKHFFILHSYALCPCGPDQNHKS